MPTKVPSTGGSADATKHAEETRRRHDEINAWPCGASRLPIIPWPCPFKDTFAACLASPPTHTAGTEQGSLCLEGIGRATTASAPKHTDANKHRKQQLNKRTNNCITTFPKMGQAVAEPREQVSASCVLLLVMLVRKRLQPNAERRRHASAANSVLLAGLWDLRLRRREWMSHSDILPLTTLARMLVEMEGLGY